MRDFARSGKLTFFSRRRNILAFEKLVPEGSDLATEYPRTFTWHKKLIALPYVSLTDILDPRNIFLSLIHHSYCVSCGQVIKGMQDKEEVCQKSDVKLSSV